MSRNRFLRTAPKGSTIKTRKKRKAAAYRPGKEKGRPAQGRQKRKYSMKNSIYSRDVLLSQIGIAPEPQKESRQTARRAASSPASSMGQGTPATFVPEQIKAESTLLSLMSVGKVQPGAVDSEAFSDPQLRQIAQQLLEGKKQAELLGECAPEEKGVLLEIYNYEPPTSGDELQRVVTDCLERMRRGWIEKRIRKLTESMAKATATEKREMLKEIDALNTEKKRLQPGRKE